MAVAPEERFVCVVGVGGVGSHCAHALVRAGIRRLRLVDFDRVSLSSLNRHAVATRRDVGTSKVRACAQHFREIRPDCKIEARDAMFTADSAGELLGGSIGERPHIVIDCIDDVSTKADLLAECVSRGVCTLSALGSGAKSDATSLCVAKGLQDIENDPLAAKLRKIFSVRQVDLQGVTFVYSSQKPQRKLLPLTEEQRAAPQEFGNVANFRLRVIPVMGTQPAAEGIVLAMEALLGTAAGQRPYHPRSVAPPRRALVERYLDELKQREAADLDITVSEASYAVQEGWHCRSAFSGPGDGVGGAAAPVQKLTLARWDPAMPLSIGNIILASEKEAIERRKPADVSPELRAHVECTLAEMSRQLAMGFSQRAGAAQEPQLLHESELSWRTAGGPETSRQGRQPAKASGVAGEREALTLEQLSRSAAFFGTDGQASVRGAFVVVVGLGTVGSAVASMLARAGVRRLRLIDSACVRVHLSFHAVAKAGDLGTPKVKVCQARLQEILPDCDVEVMACDFETADQFGASKDGLKPSAVIECTSSLSLKHRVIQAAVGMGLHVVSALVAGAADPTRIAVTPLKEAYASPAVAALRLALDADPSTTQGQGQVDVVHTQECNHWVGQAEPRISGLARLFAGMVVAAAALCRLSGEPLPEAPKPGLVGNWKKLRRGLQQRHNRGESGEVPDALALGFVAEQLWQGRSGLSRSLGGAAGLSLVRWDHSKPIGLANLVLMTHEEAEAHAEEAEGTGSLPRSLLEALEGGRVVASETGEGQGTSGLLECQLRVHQMLQQLRDHLEDDYGATARPSLPSARPSESLSVASNGPPLPLPLPLSLSLSICAGAGILATCAVLARGGHQPVAALGPRIQKHARALLAAVASSVAAGLLLTARLGGADLLGSGTLRAGDGAAPRLHRGRAQGSEPPAGFTGLVGNTPLIELRSLSQGTGCRILAKAEFLNPGGCQKDRAALHIIAAAEASGALGPGGTVVEGTSGSTGISLSLAAAERGYKVHIVMPDDQASEKALLLQRFGAEVELVRPASITSPEHYVNVARRRAAELSQASGSKGAVFADQFENLANFEAHFTGTGPEIWEQSHQQVDAFVMSAGTGGTLAGVGSYLKSVSPSVRVCLADVSGSSLYNKVVHGVLYTGEQAEQTTRRHRTDSITEGIGIDRLTANFAKGLEAHNGGSACIDEAVRVSDQEALDMAHYLLAREGLFVGSSAAVNCAAAVKLARRLRPGSSIITVLCDSGLRHLTRFYNPSAWPDFGLAAPAPYDSRDLSFIS